MWRAYVKDILNMSSKPKAFLRVEENSIEDDTLISSTSSIVVDEVPTNINNGDVVVVLDEHGIAYYQGVVKSIEDNTIQLSSILDLFKDQTIYAPISSITAPNSSQSDPWTIVSYDITKDNPTPSDFIGVDVLLTEYASRPYYIGDNYGDGYSCLFRAYFYFNQNINLALNFIASNSGSITIDGQLMGTHKSEDEQTPPLRFNYSFTVGWHEVEVCYNAKSVPTGFYLYTDDEEELEDIATHVRRTATYHLEDSIVKTLKMYCEGKVRGSSYVDSLRNQELGSFSITSTTDNEGRLETMKANSTITMSEFLRSMFEKYQILVKVNVPYEGNPTVEVFKPNYTMLKISNNSSLIKSISPTTKIEQTNKLIIYGSNGLYRATYISFSDGTSLKEPQTIANRFEVINTKFAFSDDEESDIVASNLPTTFYNHKLTFVLRLGNDALTYDDFKFGRPLQIWNGTDFFSTIVTGVKFNKRRNQEVNEVEITCGMVRLALTKKMKMGVI